jgi:Rv2175c C-terminal domain of unknown function
VNDAPDLDTLVGEWLTLPDIADILGIDVGKVRRLVQDRHLVGVRRGERNVFQIPAAFLVPDADAPRGEDGAPGRTVLASLQGTVVLLSDAGFADDEILQWLFEEEPSLEAAPVEALRAGRKSEVRRVAQALA